MKQPKILILHDYFLYRGGGERLIISMAKYLKADIAAAFIGKDAFDPREHGITTFELVREGRFSRIPGFRYSQVQLAFLFKTRNLIKDYDVIIYSGDCLTALVRAGDKVNIAYMHTPPRHLYDSYQDRLRQYGLLKKLIFVPFAIINRFRFSQLSKKFDAIMTNAVNVQNRIRDYLHLESIVVYPPCNTLPFKFIAEGDYFFSWARLYPAKRVDQIVQAFTQMPEQKLIVGSGGPELEKIQKITEGHSNITILNWMSDADLIDYLGKCRASIYIPVREDFGMSPVESMTAGKPVIGVAEGGMLEVIRDGENGVLLKSDFTVTDIVNAVRSLTPEKIKQMRPFCEQTAAQFTEESFGAGVTQVIAETIARKTKVVQA